MQVNHDGKIMPCCIDWKVQNVIGDANTSSLQDIWNGYKLYRLRINHLNGNRNSSPSCSGCSMNEESDIDNIDSSADQILLRMRKKYETLIDL
jgi:radical SAM protein with 4Fe4S-binding SPASM domain